MTSSRSVAALGYLISSISPNIDIANAGEHWWTRPSVHVVQSTTLLLPRALCARGISVALCFSKVLQCCTRSHGQLIDNSLNAAACLGCSHDPITAYRVRLTTNHAQTLVSRSRTLLCITVLLHVVLVVHPLPASPLGFCYARLWCAECCGSCCCAGCACAACRMLVREISTHSACWLQLTVCWCSVPCLRHHAAILRGAVCPL